MIQRVTFPVGYMWFIAGYCISRIPIVDPRFFLAFAEAQSVSRPRSVLKLKVCWSCTYVTLPHVVYGRCVSIWKPSCAGPYPASSALPIYGLETRAGVPITSAGIQCSQGGLSVVSLVFTQGAAWLVSSLAH